MKRFIKLVFAAPIVALALCGCHEPSDHIKADTTLWVYQDNGLAARIIEFTDKYGNRRQVLITQLYAPQGIGLDTLELSVSPKTTSKENTKQAPREDTQDYPGDFLDNKSDLPEELDDEAVKEERIQRWIKHRIYDPARDPTINMTPEEEANYWSGRFQG